MKRTLIFGYGYLGRRVAELAKSAGDCVYATTRSDEKLAAITAAGLQPLRCDWTDPETLRRTLATVGRLDRVLVAVAYDRSSSVDRQAAMVGGLANLLETLQSTAGSAKGLTKLCYISTTGVYHQRDAQWVDEQSPTQPSREGGIAHLQAESLLENFVTGQNAQTNADGWGITHRTLRLSGIYGPGRIPRAADVRQGRPIASPQHGYLNLIHVDDAAAAVVAAWDLPADAHGGHPDRLTYLISDDEPVARHAFYQRIADHYAVAPPVFCDPAKDASVRFRSESNKRIRNVKMKQQLGVELRFPTYREGLQHALDA